MLESSIPQKEKKENQSGYRELDSGSQLKQSAFLCVEKAREAEAPMGHFTLRICCFLSILTDDKTQIIPYLLLELRFAAFQVRNESSPIS